MYHGLRALALEADPRELLPPPEFPGVCGIVVDIPSSGGHATVVALADGTTSMYTSVGGGVLGAGTHSRVAAASSRLLATAQRFLDVLTSSPATVELPPPGLVRVHLRTPTANHALDVTDDIFWDPAGQPVEPLISAIQSLITALRQTSPS